ncbi:hypothetical protein HDU76_013228 [Blyttiomyces sp. JEL0837]|nr:hypothetical protein HDU76_013228 [Blyttiomyces sp. JEL0837]
MGRKKGSSSLAKGNPFRDNNDDDDQDWSRSKRSAATIKAMNTIDDIGGDSEDEFHQQRESILLGEEGFSRGFDDDQLSEEEVLGLKGVDSDEDEEDELEEGDDLDEADDEFLEKAQKRLLAKIGTKMDDDEDEEDEEAKKRKKLAEEEGDLAWGRKRQQFYDRDDVESDEEAAKEEEAEALRLQKKRLNAMSEDDFLDAELGDSFARRVATVGTVDGTDAAKDDDDLLVRALTGMEDETGAGEGDDLDRRRKALERMDPENLKVVTQAQAEDVIKVLKQFEERWDEVSTVVGPALKYMVEQVNREGPAKAYLELKFRLVMTYLTNAAFYLALRANPPNGIDAKSHPVMETLTELQGLLAKMESTVEGRVTEEEEKAKSKKKKGKKGKSKEVETPAGFPNLLDQIADFVEDALEDEDEEDFEDADQNIDEEEDEWKDAVEEEGEEEEEIFPVKAKSKSTKAKESKKAEKAALLPAKQVSKKRKGAAVDLDDEVEVPDVQDLIEIPKFVPLGSKKTASSNGSKTQKKNKKQKVSAGMDDFGEDDLNEFDLADKMRRRKDLKFHVTRLDQQLAKKARLRSAAGDEDIPLRDKFGRFIEDGPAETKPAKAQEDNDIFGGGVDESALDDVDPRQELDDLDGFDDVEGFGLGDGGLDDVEVEMPEGDDDDEANEALEYYESVKNARKEKIEAKEKAIADYKQSLEPDSLYDENDLAEGKRGTTWAIMSNKGLTPKRKKEDRNPRVKKRLRYEKAKKKLSSIKAIPVDKSKIGAYGGEATGIKANLVKSIKFK